MPFALRVPVDGEQLVFDDTTSKLTIRKITMDQVEGLDDALASGSAVEIVDGKLATITTPGKVLGDAITSGTITGSTIFSGSGGMTTTGPISGSGNVTVQGTGTATTELRFADQDSSNYVGFKAPGTLSANKVWTLPASDGSAGQVLKTDGLGNFSWVSGLAPTGAAGGDLTGSFQTPQLADNSVSSAEIADGAIMNAEIANTAGIATSKLSGSLWE